MIKFNCTKEEVKLIVKILNRAEKNDNTINHLDSSMDIEACHSNGTPLNLQKFLDSDDLNFNHDFYGIRRHINRETGELMNCFVPRCSA
jgi:hypothetical protein